MNFTCPNCQKNCNRLIIANNKLVCEKCHISNNNSSVNLHSYFRLDNGHKISEAEKKHIFNRVPDFVNNRIIDKTTGKEWRD